MDPAGGARGGSDHGAGAGRGVGPDASSRIPDARLLALSDLLLATIGGVFALAALALCTGVSVMIASRGHRIVGLAGAAALVAALMLWFRWQKVHGQPRLLARMERRLGRVVAIWGLILAAAIAFLIVRDQAQTRKGVCFHRVMAALESSGELAARLGRPLSVGWWVSGSEQLAKSGEQWHFEFSISGPKGSAHVWTEGKGLLGHGAVQRERLLVTVDQTGECIELAGPQSAREAP